MGKKLVKKVFPLVPGTEVTIKYKNQFGNKVAVNINSEKGLPVDKLEGDLELQVLHAIRAGTLVIKEVEVVEKKENKDAMLKELEKLAGLTAEHKTNKTNTAEAKKIATNKKSAETHSETAGAGAVSAEAEAEHTIHGRRRGK